MDFFFPAPALHPLVWVSSESRPQMSPKEVDGQASRRLWRVSADLWGKGDRIYSLPDCPDPSLTQDGQAALEMPVFSSLSCHPGPEARPSQLSVMCLTVVSSHCLTESV